MRQTHEKNLHDLLDFPWENFMKQITGQVAKQFFLNWLHSFAEGLLKDGRSIEEAIGDIEKNINNFTALQQAISNLQNQVGADADPSKTVEQAIVELRQQIATGGGEGPGVTFSEQFKLLGNILYWDPGFLAAQYSSDKIYTCQSISTGIPGGTGFQIIELAYSNLQNSLVRISGEIKYINNENLQQDQLYGRSELDGVPSSADFVSINQTITDQWQAFDIQLGESRFEEPYQTNGYVLGISNSSSNATIGPNTVIQLRNVKLYDKNDNPIPILGASNTLYFSITEETSATNPLTGTRVQHLTLSTAGQKPTLPAAGAMPGDDNWLETDLMKSEWCFNEADDIWYYNNGKEIKPYESAAIIIDAALNSESTNPVQNKVINAALKNILKRTVKTLTVSSNIINLNFESLQQLVADNMLAISANASITISNAPATGECQFRVNITNLATLTFPTGTYMQESDSRWDSTNRIFTPESDGQYELVMTITTGAYYLKVSYKMVGV